MIGQDPKTDMPKARRHCSEPTRCGTARSCPTDRNRRLPRRGGPQILGRLFAPYFGFKEGTQGSSLNSEALRWGAWHIVGLLQQPDHQHRSGPFEVVGIRVDLATSRIPSMRTGRQGPSEVARVSGKVGCGVRIPKPIYFAEKMMQKPAARHLYHRSLDGPIRKKPARRST